MMPQFPRLSRGNPNLTGQQAVPVAWSIGATKQNCGRYPRPQSPPDQGGYRYASRTGRTSGGMASNRTFQKKSFRGRGECGELRIMDLACVFSCPCRWPFDGPVWLKKKPDGRVFPINTETCPIQKLPSGSTRKEVMKKQITPAIPAPTTTSVQPLAVNLNEACRLLSISRASMYRLLGRQCGRFLRFAACHSEFSLGWCFV